MRFRTEDETIIWEDTNQIVLHNYPPSHNTFSYVTRVYREYKLNSVGYKLVESDPIYLRDMNNEKETLAIIMGTAQHALLRLLKHQEGLIELKQNE